jgi:hypothetical protein
MCEFWLLASHVFHSSHKHDQPHHYPRLTSVLRHSLQVVSVLEKSSNGWWRGAIAPIALGAKAEVGWFPSSHVTEGVDDAVPFASQREADNKSSSSRNGHSNGCTTADNNNDDDDDDALAFRKAVLGLNSWGCAATDNDTAQCDGVDATDQTERNNGVAEMDMCTSDETVLCQSLTDSTSSTSSTSNTNDAGVNVAVVNVAFDAAAHSDGGDRADSCESDTTSIDVVFPPLPPPRKHPHSAAPNVTTHVATSPHEMHLELPPPPAFA